jgi:hypothetical protein
LSQCVSSTGATVLRSEAEALVLPPEDDEDVELEDVELEDVELEDVELEDGVSVVLLPDRDAASYPPATPDLFPVDFFANNSCVWEIMNTDEIIVTATKVMINPVHAPILLLFIKELLYSVYFSFHISIFEYIY